MKKIDIKTPYVKPDIYSQYDIKISEKIYHFYLNKGFENVLGILP